MFLAAVLLAGCGSGGGGSSSGGSGGVGTLSLSLSDASTDRYKAVYVTITDIQVHQPGGNENNPNSWYSVDMPASPMTVNLLELVNGVREDLGIVDLEAGPYTQMRLIIGQTPERNGAINILSQAHPYANYVIDLNDVYHELKVPSGSQSGYKIVGGFDINANSTTELVLDFDANRSVVEAGNSGQWLLKPTVKIAYLDDDSIIQGRVSGPGGAAISGAIVSAQVYTHNAATADQVTVQASTVTDMNGDYQLFVRDGSYNLVVYAANYAPASKKVTIGPGTVNTENFPNMSGSGMGTITGSVTISTSGDEQYATLSFRNTLIGGEKIEVYSINIRDTNSYSVDLPAGTYTVVATTYGSANTFTQSVTVTENTTTSGVDIVL
jgi:hypothetical protein